MKTSLNFFASWPQQFLEKTTSFFWQKLKNCKQFRRRGPAVPRQGADFVRGPSDQELHRASGSFRYRSNCLESKALSEHKKAKFGMCTDTKKGPFIRGKNQTPNTDRQTPNTDRQTPKKGLS